MSIYFIRHGETDWNLTRKLQGQSDITLNDTGRKQAMKAAQTLKDLNFTKIYTSPMLRAKETATILNEQHAVEVIEESDLMERGFGEWEGTCLTSEQFDSLWYRNQSVDVVGVESMDDFFHRVQGFLARIVKQARKEDVLIVAHGGVFIPCYCYFHPEACNTNMKDIIIGNCVIARLDEELIKN